MAEMTGKTCVVTGATSGIGLEAAQRLVAMGARLVLVGRDPAKGEAALSALRAAAPAVEAELILGDLSGLAEIRRIAAAIAQRAPRLDVLLNNAGAIFNRREVTADGLERTFALNHMAYYVLTRLLQGPLAAAAPARVVSVASGAHRGASLDFDDLQTVRSYSGWLAYKRSKLSNILFTRELARRLAGTGVTANCLHPGFVATSFGDNNRGFYRWGINLAKRFTARSIEEGARTSVYLASAADVGANGAYFDDCRLATPSAAAQDDAAARRLWEASAALAGLAP